MERNKNSEIWHKETKIRLSQLAIEMYQAFTPGHESEQSEEYMALQDEYLQLQTNEAWYDILGEDHDKSHFTCG